MFLALTTLGLMKYATPRTPSVNMVKITLELLEKA